MTTRPDHHEPLDAQERDLAARLGRAGLPDGPPPALDTKILAAAHAAAARRTSGRRHLAWLGIPPALVTGVGVAAAAVLALGLVWQLRPHYGARTVQGEADAGEEIILITESPAPASAPAANPPPLPEVADAATTPAARKPVPVAAPPSAQATAPGEVAPAAATAESAPAPLARAAAAPEATREAEATARAAQEDEGFVAEPPPAPAPAGRDHATYTTAARAAAERRERMARQAKVETDAAETAAAASAANSATVLDRIEVTGSRMKSDDIDWTEVPVQEDSRLSAAEWLERVRARRDSGEIDSARVSLRLFQREYPRVRLPDDLRALLAEAPRR